MGIDRWVAMVGAWTEVQSACLVVDVGTAMTIDAIDDEGKHLGGQIIAGVATMANALATAASDIPQVKPAPGRDSADLAMFARNTAAAVREGAQNAVVGAIDRAIRTLQSNAYDPAIVLTGGDSSRILNALCETPMHRPHLVLQGLAHMLEHAR
jgi:type III pantothenate kinase